MLYYSHDIISTECAADKYGVNCQEDCSSYCADSGTCDHQDGTCSPCQEWRIGDKCDYELGVCFELNTYLIE